jgi:DNA-binding transcriptional LysR family regulator
VKPANGFHGHDVLGYPKALERLPAARWIREHATRARIVSSFDFLDMVDATANGLGIGVLPCLLANTTPGLVRLVPELVSRRDMTLVYRKDVGSRRSVRRVIALITHVVREEADNFLEGNTGRSATPAT